MLRKVGPFFGLKFKQFVIRLALRHPAPAGSFTLGNKLNYQSAGFLHGEETLPFFRILEIKRDHLAGTQIEDEEWRHPACVSFESLRNEKFIVRQWYFGNTIIYSSYRDYFWHWLTAYPLRVRLSNFIKQRFFNITTKFQHDRIEILKRLVNLDLAHSEYGRREFSEIWDFGEFYGERAYGHPDYEVESRRFQLIVSSLVETGELEQTADRFKVTGKALTTIAKHETEERRHRDHKNHNLLIFMLTLVLAVTSVVSAVSAYRELNEPELNPTLDLTNQ